MSCSGMRTIDPPSKNPLTRPARAVLWQGVETLPSANDFGYIHALLAQVFMPSPYASFRFS